MDNQKGILFVFITALVSGTAVFVNSFAVNGADPFSFVTVRNLAVALLLVAAVLLAGQVEALRKLSRKNWAQLALIGLVGGSIPFLLFFKGVSLVDGGARASFLYRSLFVVAAVLATIWLRERLTKRILVGVAIAMGGNALLLGDAMWSGWGVGEMLVLGATVMWATEYLISKKVMNDEGLSPKLLALGRMGFGALFLLAFTAFTGQLWGAGMYAAVQWQWIAVSAAFLFAFVSFWYIGLANTSVINAAAALVLGGPITALLAFAFAGKAVEPLSAAGLFLMAFGSALIIGYSNFSEAWNFLRKNYLGRMISWVA